MKKEGMIKIHCIYSAIMLFMLLILICAVTFLIGVLQKTSSVTPQKRTEYIYVYSSKDDASSEETSTETSGWIVKEHSEKIGIFKKDGTLIQVIDTYIKTLPKADEELLREGIEIETQAELNSIIEDYSS